MKIDNPPEPPHRPDTSNLSSKEKKQEQSEYRKKVKEYEEQLKTEIVSPANAALGQIEQEVERLQMEMDAAEASEKEARRKSQEAVGRVKAVSAVLYRTVNEKIRSEDIVFGDP